MFRLAKALADIPPGMSKKIFLSILCVSKRDCAAGQELRGEEPRGTLTVKKEPSPKAGDLSVQKIGGLSRRNT